MGVPSLFRTLLRDHPEVYASEPPMRRACEALYLDFNCLIHHASRLANGGDDEEIIKCVVAYTRAIINTHVKPTRLVYIAMDGPVPYSKMIRQRERRFKKVKDDAFLNVDTADRFDSNKITPGTAFMHKLSARLRGIISLGVLCTPEVLFSDASVPGEGEWKIYNHLRANNHLRSVTVYGLDADLIVWSMACNRIDVVLCRENEENQIMFFHLEKSLTYIFHKYHLYHKYTQHTYGLLLDLVIILMLGGNDFVCPIECMKIRDHGWDALVAAYAECNIQITCPYTLRVNWDHFYEYMRYVSQYEYKLSKQKYERQLVQSAAHRPSDRNDPDAIYHHGMFASPHHPLHAVYGKQALSIPYFEPLDVWKVHYYERIFGTPHTVPGFMQTLCTDYLASIVWCWDYYIHPRVPSWSFGYEHIAAPCLTDVVRWFPSSIEGAHARAHTDVLNGHSLSPIEQLVCVLPRSGAGLLPRAVRTLLSDEDNPLSEYDVDRFVIEPITGQKMIYSTPFLPPIDITIIKRTIHCISYYFDATEVLLNTLSHQPFVHK